MVVGEKGPSGLTGRRGCRAEPGEAEAGCRKKSERSGADLQESSARDVLRRLVRLHDSGRVLGELGLDCAYHG